MNRSTLTVLSVLALCALPSLTSAQSPTLAKETVLFDFEGGHFDGWTLSGNCFAKQPATAKTFVDRQGTPLVSGIVGSGYLTTLFQSAATTGKAVSKEFTIDRPFLTFRIGGGNYPKQACLNLVVEGKIVRTETGNDSAELRPAYFDVYALLGKTAHLEVVDASQNPNRGYIMLDDIRLTERSPLRPQMILENFNISPHFLEYSTFLRNATEKKRGRWLPFGVTETELRNLKNEVWRRAIQFSTKYEPGQTIEFWGLRIRSTVDEVLSISILSPSTLLKQWLYAEATCAWVANTITYYVSPDDPYKDGNWTLNAPVNVLKRSKSWAQCCGYGMMVRDIAHVVGREVGLKCYYVGGWYRAIGTEAPIVTNHGWNMFLFEGDIYVPADATWASSYLHNGNLKKDKKPELLWFCLPQTRDEVEMFMACFWGDIYPEAKSIHGVDLSKVPGREDVWTTLPLNEWRNINTSYLRPIFDSKAKL